MATNAQWTVVFEDKLVIKQSGDAAGTGYNIVDNDFWGLAKWDNVWAIQYGTSNPSDTVEYRDGTPHSTWEDANLGDFSDFTSRWDSAHLAQLQSNWDDDNEEDETEADKIARLGSRPTSYTS
jgi:hypothetical protein|tara:strand:+ start:345 stop:713 length:369 start_codon:yes stop_codon:yes gene_type:complete